MGKHLLPIGDDIGEEQKEKGCPFADPFTALTGVAHELSHLDFLGNPIDMKGSDDSDKDAIADYHEVLSTRRIKIGSKIFGRIRKLGIEIAFGLVAARPLAHFREVLFV